MPSEDEQTTSWLQRTLRRLAPRRNQGDVIAADVGAGAQHVAVGKNIVQIGSLAVPLVPLLLLCVIAAAGLASFLWWAYRPGPQRMAGAFNVAVADFGVLDERGQPVRSEVGRRLSTWVYTELTRRQDEAERTTSGIGANVWFWYDGLPRSQKGVEIGVIGGASPETRRNAAKQVAEQIKADVLIYGDIRNGALLPEFYVRPQQRLEFDANTGSFQLGAEPIPVDLAQPLAVERELTRRTNTLFWLIQGLQYSSLGAANEAYELLRRAGDNLATWDGRASGNDLLFFLKGQSALFVAQQTQDPAAFGVAIADASEAFDMALRANPQNVRAYIGRGSVAKTRADRIEDPAALLASDLLQQARENYQEALRLAPESSDPVWSQGVAQAAIGTVDRLEGDAEMRSGRRAQQQGDSAQVEVHFQRANAAFQASIDHLTAALDVLRDLPEYRLIGQTYLAIGNAASQFAELHGYRNDTPGRRVWYQRASEFYGKCVALATNQEARTDELLMGAVIEQGCRRYKQIADSRVN